MKWAQSIEVFFFIQKWGGYCEENFSPIYKNCGMRYTYFLQKKYKLSAYLTDPDKKLTKLLYFIYIAVLRR